MPKERRSRVKGHQSSVKLPQRTFAVGEKQVEQVEVGSEPEVSANEILQQEDGEDHGLTQLKKKEKLALKKEAFMQKLELSRTHSKSHERRMKRKAKEQIANGMSDMQSALAALEEATFKESIETQPEEESANVKDGKGESRTSSSKSLKIGQGKPEPLSRAQRKKALQLERLRHPLILTNPTFSSNPFSTVRVHAQNTLVKHQTPA